MANEVSFSMSRNGLAMDVLANGSQTVTEGTSAPGAGDIEIRISDVTAGWTQLQVSQALDIMERFLLDRSKSVSIPL